MSMSHGTDPGPSPGNCFRFHLHHLLLICCYSSSASNIPQSYPTLKFKFRFTPKCCGFKIIICIKRRDKV
jgi:hypothetical protein